LSHGLDEYTTKPLVRSEIVSILNQFLSDLIVDADNDSEKIIADEEIEKISEEVLIVSETVEDSADKTEEIQSEMQENVILEEKVEVPLKAYKADILLTKKNKIETKLFARVLAELKYTYEIAENVADMEEKLKHNRYKLALFDKELSGLDLADLSNTTKEFDSEIYLVMMVDPASEAEEADALYVHEIIKNIVNKDLLRLVFEKFV